MNDFLVKSYLNLGKSKEWPRGRKLIGNIDLYCISFAKYSDLLVENHKNVIPTCI